ncbi:MAG TPA: phosphoribosyltransferase family protein [Patescibacteria group bacterium]|nr:phosphoribosyltransferase family protein [Patescibacteria group bacterium]
MESRFGDLGFALNDAAREAGRLLAAAAFPHFCCGCGAEGSVLCEACGAETKTPYEGIFVCPGCGERTPAGGRCGARRCRAGALDGLVSAAPYGKPVLRELLRLYKYERVGEAGEALLRLFGGFARRHRIVLAACGATMIVPVPMHPFREAYRGFNQAEVLAGVLAAEVGLPVAGTLLRRRFGFSAQARLEDSRARRRNVRGRVTSVAPVARGSVCLLVDDVVTTGATLEACAAALKKAGAAEVRAVTLLRGATLHKNGPTG